MKWDEIDCYYRKFFGHSYHVKDLIIDKNIHNNKEQINKQFKKHPIIINNMLNEHMGLFDDMVEKLYH